MEHLDAAQLWRERRGTRTCLLSAQSVARSKQSERQQCNEYKRLAAGEATAEGPQGRHAFCRSFCRWRIGAALPIMGGTPIFSTCACEQRAIYRGELPVSEAKKPTGGEMSRTVWFGGLTVRSVFIAILIAITARVASPQIEHIWAIWETPGDFVRVAIGFAVCVWLVVHLFILPKDAGGYRTWLYLGVVIIPLSALCAFVIW
jgi:hypothetical protein